MCRDPVSSDAFRSQSCKDRCRDRVTFYDPRSSSNTPGLRCDLITTNDEVLCRFRRMNRARSRFLSKSVIDQSFRRQPQWERVKVKKLHGQFFFLILFHHFPSFLFFLFSFSLSPSSFRFRGFRFVKTNIQSFRRYPPSGITREIS